MFGTQLHLYELLRAKLGNAEAEAFVAVLESQVDSKFEQQKEMLATKKDLYNVKESLEEKIDNLRAEMLRTYYLVSLGQLIAIVGAVMALFNLLK
jgi:hypothetical protein